MRAHPGAARERVSWDGEVLHVWVGERALEGRANRAVVRAIARALDVRPSAVALATGQRSRDKVVEVELDAHDGRLERDAAWETKV